MSSSSFGPSPSSVQVESLRVSLTVSVPLAYVTSLTSLAVMPPIFVSTHYFGSPLKASSASFTTTVVPSNAT